METSPSDYQIMHEFITELEEKRPATLDDVDKQRMEQFLNAFGRVWPGGRVEQFSPKADFIMTLIIGAFVGFGISIAYNFLAR